MKTVWNITFQGEKCTIMLLEEKISDKKKSEILK